MNLDDLKAEIEEKFDSRVEHPTPGGGDLRRWFESLPLKPVSITITLPPRDDRKPRKLHKLMWRYQVVVSDAPEPHGNRLQVLMVTAESAAHARHFGARLYRLDSPKHPVEFWVKARLIGGRKP